MNMKKKLYFIPLSLFNTIFFILFLPFISLIGFFIIVFYFGNEGFLKSSP